jgi:hypothetical protein
MISTIRFNDPVLPAKVNIKVRRVIEFDTTLYINAPRIQSKNSSSRTYFPFPLIDEVSKFTVSQKMSGDYSTAILNFLVGTYG